jgi:hypothetical protein
MLISDLETDFSAACPLYIVDALENDVYPIFDPCNQIVKYVSSVVRLAAKGSSKAVNILK